MNRRTLILAAAALPVAGLAWTRGSDAAEGAFEVTRTEAEWRAMLTPAEYRVLREDGTERAGSSPLDKIYDPGLYHCKGCDLPVYSSEAKYDSRTGWPSFWASLPDAVRTRPDRTLFMRRTEVHCRRCGSHFGHVFDDGPPPTGKRHCLNGIALTFVAA
jgi:peptide-methionine (R)-S-oxide reductase